MTTARFWILPLLACAAALAQPAPPGQYAAVNGARIYYEECGQPGVNLVLLHDGLLHSVTWDDVLPSLCSRYHVLRYDRRGYGRSEAAHARFAPEEDLSALMRLVKMDRAILVGNSSGAGLALDFALAHPDMTEGLFLIGPVVHGMPSSAYFTECGNQNNQPLDHGDAQGAAENWSRDKFLIAGPKPDARKKLLDALAQNPQNLKVPGQFEIRPSPPTVLRLSQIKAPALVLVGDADIADVIAYAGAIEAALPIVFMEVWKDCGHLIQLERPADLTARLEKFSALAGRREAAVPLETLRGYIGDYKIGSGQISITFREDRLWLRLPDLPDKPLFASSPNRFFVRTTETELEFARSAAENSLELVIHNSGGGTIHCPRI